MDVKNNPDFLEWFGDSKIVDDNDDPLRVYHGTTRSFTVFDADGSIEHDEEESGDRVGKGTEAISFLGSHFARETRVANIFTKGPYNRSHRKEGGNVIPVYLRIVKPYETNETDMMNQMLKGSYNTWSVEQAIEDYVDMDTDAETADEVAGWYDEDEAYREEINKIALNIEAGLEEPSHELSHEMADAFRNRLMSLGYDGIIYDNEIEGGTSYIIFSPNQAKSALSSRFGTSDDIRENIAEQILGLCEAASHDSYMQMFSKLECVQDENSQKILTAIIQTCIDKARKNNIILWLLRFLRLILIEKKGTPRDKERLETEKQKLASTYGEEAIDRFLKSTIRSGMFTEIAEYIGDEDIKNEPEFLNYDLLKNTPDRAYEDLGLIENEIMRRKRQEKKTGNYEDKRYVLVEDAEAEDHEDLGISDREGWSWWRIPREKDELEARSNEHCGEGDEGSILYSFREDQIFDDEPATVSHLTFEKRWNGMLGMTKGTANSKPKPEYYGAIVELLCKERSIVGMLIEYGYRPETNFEFDDLSEEQQMRVEKAKPRFMVREYENYRDKYRDENDEPDEDDFEYEDEEREYVPEIVTTYRDGYYNTWERLIDRRIGSFGKFASDLCFDPDPEVSFMDMVGKVGFITDHTFECIKENGDLRTACLELLYLWEGFGGYVTESILGRFDDGGFTPILDMRTMEEVMGSEMFLFISRASLNDYIVGKYEDGFDWDNRYDNDFTIDEARQIFATVRDEEKTFEAWCEDNEEIVNAWEEKFKERFNNLDMSGFKREGGEE